MNHYRIKKVCLSKILVSAVIVMLLFISGCGGNSDRNAAGGTEKGGSLLVVGSTALQPLAEQAARQFVIENPEVDIQVQGGGSGQGLTAATQGIADIGNSDIFADEKRGIDAKALEDHKVCVAGFAVITNPKVNVDNLTSKQLVDIFTGKVDNWSKVGGSNMDVVIINRPASSGTRATFKKYGLGGADEAVGKALTQDSSGTVLKNVSETDGAISYIGLSYIKNNNNIKVVKLDGIEPSAENIADGKYKIWSYEHMYTKGPAVGLKKDFIDFILSDKIKLLIRKLGYIPVSDMKVTR